MIDKITYSIIVVMLVVIAILIMIVRKLRNESKDLLGRRNKKDKPQQQAEANLCSKQCALYCSLEADVIPELKSEIEYWKQSFKKEQQCNALMHSELAKLRTSKENSNET